MRAWETLPTSANHARCVSTLVWLCCCVSLHSHCSYIALFADMVPSRPRRNFTWYHTRRQPTTRKTTSVKALAPTHASPDTYIHKTHIRAHTHITNDSLRIEHNDPNTHIRKHAGPRPQGAFRTVGEQEFAWGNAKIPARQGN